MEKDSKELTKILASIIKIVILAKLDLIKKDTITMLSMGILSESKSLGATARLSLFMAMPLVITKIEGSLGEESMAALIEAIEDSGIKAEKFVEEMLVEEINGRDFIASALMDRKQVENLELLRGTLINENRKKVGDRVTICNELLTNMLVTSDGMQMPSKSRNIAAVPELMGLTATVVSVDNTSHNYLCGGCDRKHLADTRIAFDDYNMEFYIDNDFIKVVENEK